MKAVVNIRREITDVEIAFLVMTAVEQGIGYWARVRQYDGDLLFDIACNGKPSDFNEDDIILLLRENQPDDDDGRWYTLTPAKIARGIERFLTGVRRSAATSEYWKRQDPNGWQFEPREFADMGDFGAVDAFEADAVIQLGLLGELRYG